MIFGVGGWGGGGGGWVNWKKWRDIPMNFWEHTVLWSIVTFYNKCMSILAITIAFQI